MREDHSRAGCPFCRLPAPLVSLTQDASSTSGACPPKQRWNARSSVRLPFCILVYFALKDCFVLQCMPCRQNCLVFVESFCSLQFANGRACLTGPNPGNPVRQSRRSAVSGRKPQNIGRGSRVIRRSMMCKSCKVFERPGHSVYFGSRTIGCIVSPGHTGQARLRAVQNWGVSLAYLVACVCSW